MKKTVLCIVLAVILLVSATPFSAVNAQTDKANLTLADVSTLFYALAGSSPLSVRKTAAADNNQNGMLDMADVVAAFYCVNGHTDLLKQPLSYTANYLDIADNTAPIASPVVLTTKDDYWEFIDLHTDVSYYTWDMQIDFTQTDYIVVPISSNNGYVANVSCDDRAVYIAWVTVENAVAHTAPHTAYAFVGIANDAAQNKTIVVTPYADQATESGEKSIQAYRKSSTTATSGLQDLHVRQSQTYTALTFTYTFTSPGYTFKRARYTAADGILLMELELTVPLSSDVLLMVMETYTFTVIVDSLNIDIDNIVISEHRRERENLGEPIAYQTVYQQDHMNSDANKETTAQLITSLEQLQAAYDAETATSVPDYTAGYTEEYFEKKALILVSAFQHNIPNNVIVDQVAANGTTLNVSVFFSFVEPFSPALYHGRILVAIDARIADHITQVQCKTTVDTLLTTQ